MIKCLSDCWTTCWGFICCEDKPQLRVLEVSIARHDPHEVTNIPIVQRHVVVVVRPGHPLYKSTDMISMTQFINQDKEIQDEDSDRNKKTAPISEASGQKTGSDSHA